MTEELRAKYQAIADKYGLPAKVGDTIFHPRQPATPSEPDPSHGLGEHMRNPTP